MPEPQQGSPQALHAMQESRESVEESTEVVTTTTTETKVEFEDSPEYLPTLHIAGGHTPQAAANVIFAYVSERLDKTDTHVEFGIEDVYVVWFAYTLGNWKALVSTRLPDLMYYEVTYDGMTNRLYIDAYRKLENKAFDVKR